MLDWLKWMFKNPSRDLSKHRLHTTKYEDYNHSFENKKTNEFNKTTRRISK